MDVVIIKTGNLINGMQNEPCIWDEAKSVSEERIGVVENYNYLSSRVARHNTLAEAPSQLVHAYMRSEKNRHRDRRKY